MPPRVENAEFGRRAALGALAAGGLGFAVWPYRPRSERDIPPGRVVLTYWEKWTGSEGLALQRVIDAFNDGQDRIWVNRVPVGEIEPKAMLAIAGGDPPDLVGLFGRNVPQFAESNALIPIDDLRRPGELEPEHYADAIGALLRHEGQQWAGVTTCQSLALYYNREHFREAGLDPDAPPRTVDELDATASRLDGFAPDGSLERVGFVQDLPHWWPYFWPIMFGGRLYDADSDRATLTDPGCVKAYEWVGSYPKRYADNALHRFATGSGRSFHSAHDPYLSGRVSMIVQGPWMANFVRQFAPGFDYGAAPVPVDAAIYDAERPTGQLEADIIAIPRGAPNPEAAFDFLLYLQSRRVIEQLATDHCKSSPLREVTETFRRQHPNRYVDVHDAVVKSPAVQVEPRTRVWPQYAALIKGAFDKVWAGAEAAPELEAVNRRTQALLDRAARRRRERQQRGAAS